MVNLLLSMLVYSNLIFSQQPGQALGPQGQPNLDVQPIEKISKIQSFLQPFVYDRESTRDPFETKSSNAPLEQGQVYGPFLESQMYPLKSFTLKGLLWKIDKPVAIFSSEKGKDFRLSIKDYIGENFGYIAMIREKEVVVIQTIEENDRRYSTTKVVFLDDKKTKE